MRVHGVRAVVGCAVLAASLGACSSSSARTTPTTAASPTGTISLTPITSAHRACSLEIIAMVDYAQEAAPAGGTNGVTALTKILGASSPLLRGAEGAQKQLRGGATALTVAGVIEQSCTAAKNPVLSAEELLALEKIALARDVVVLRQITVTR